MLSTVHFYTTQVGRNGVMPWCSLLVWLSAHRDIQIGNGELGPSEIYGRAAMIFVEMKTVLGGSVRFLWNRIRYIIALKLPPARMPRDMDYNARLIRLDMWTYWGRTRNVTCCTYVQANVRNFEWNDMSALRQNAVYWLMELVQYYARYMERTQL